MKRDVYSIFDSILSPAGFSTGENFSAIRSGKHTLHSRLFPFSESPFCASLIDPEKLQTHFAALADPLKYTRLERMAIACISDALSKTDLNLSNKNTLLVFSTVKGNIDLLEQNPSESNPGSEVYLGTIGKVLGSYFSCANQPVIISNACISGLLALIYAQRMIRIGLYDHVVVAGADLVSEFTLSGFRSLGALSPDPCKPFDEKRNGINLGEAAAAMVLSAIKPASGSRIRITGGASANDANHISGPSRTGDGLFASISGAMKESGRTRFDFISAHGTATGYNDEMESIAFTRSGLSGSRVNSLKGYYGHTLGAAGLLESIISCESLRRGQLIASLGFEKKGVSGDIRVLEKNESGELRTCLKTASGFGGCNAAAVFEKEGGES